MTKIGNKSVKTRMFYQTEIMHMHKESVLINKLNKQITVQFNNYARLLGQKYARTTGAYSGGASP